MAMTEQPSGSGSVPLCQCGGAALSRTDGKSVGYSKISMPYRVAFYAINAFYVEVAWTALYDYLWGNGDLRLVGYSSVWSLIIYGLAMWGIEILYFFLLDRNINVVTRGLIYTTLSFAVELAFGLVLQQFNANSWDYSNQFTYHLYGCIALEYAPLWFLGSLAFERFAVIPCTRAAFQDCKPKSS